MKYVDAQTIADIVDLHPDYIRDNLSRRKGFPDAFRVGDSLRWKLEEVLSWIEGQRVNRALPRSTRQGRGSKQAGTTGQSAQASAPDPERQGQQTAG